MKNKIKFVSDTIIEEAFVLSNQAPLEYFVYENILGHFETHSFYETMKNIERKYNKKNYMTLKFYRKQITNSRLSIKILKEFIKSSLQSHNYPDDDEIIDFLIRELDEFYLESEYCWYLENNLYINPKGKLVRFSEKDFEILNLIDQLEFKNALHIKLNHHSHNSLNDIDKFFIPFISSLCDQGLAYWVMNDEWRNDIDHSFIKYVQLSTISEFDKKSILNVLNSGIQKDKIEAIAELLKEKSNDDVRSIIREEMFSLPGWAGLLKKAEIDKESIPRKDIFLKLNDYLFYRLVFRLNHKPVESKLEYGKKDYRKNLVIWKKYQLLKFYHIVQGDFEVVKKLKLIIDGLDMVDIRQLFHQAYEMSYYTNILDHLAVYEEPKEGNQLDYQMVFCIDDREESYRRHLEEIYPKLATYGVAGFFGIDMMYKYGNSVRYRRHCPIVLKPNYYLTERSNYSRVPIISHIYHSKSSVIRSLLMLFFYVPFSYFYFELHTLFPRYIKNLVNRLRYDSGDIVFRATDDIEDPKFKGYSVQEMAQRVFNILSGAGLTNNFAPTVVIIGHGSNTFNNPHLSTYKCGACSGASGSPNAKIFSSMANDKEVRALLKENFNLHIPDSTKFIAAYHDTTDDSVEIFTTDKFTESSLDFTILEGIFKKTSERNAHERCRRFQQVSTSISEKKALRIVQNRSHHLLEARPEYNHSTNSLCVVGRRNFTRGLFLDRRAFLVSYVSDNDQQGNILKSILSAVVPVCSGINLAYYFSKVDNENYGSGSKTSHNIFGLVGVANGFRGDLRTGIVWQTVEFHEPMRMLFIIECTMAQIEKVIREITSIRDVIYNDWIKLVIKDPGKNNYYFFENRNFKEYSPGAIVKKIYSSSKAVYNKKRNQIDFAYIQS